jgi:hypothetical protein
MKLLKHAAALALTGAVSLGAAQGADAAVILTFGQTLDGATITATRVGNSTTITGDDILVTVTQIAGPPGDVDAYFSLSATSVGDAIPLPGNNVLQSYSGTFSITSLMGGGGTNYLSGTFVDAVFGSGGALTMSASQPPGMVDFTSDVIVSLLEPKALSFSFADVSPLASIEDESIDSFTSSVSGTLSGTAPPDVPEPMTMTLLGIGLMGSAFVARRRRS